jgi:hypothetical protein
MGSEGARVVTGEKQILQNPSLNFMDLKFSKHFHLTENLKMQEVEKDQK